MTPEQPPVGVIGPNQGGEERVYNVRSSVPVDPYEHEICEPWDWSCLRHEVSQEPVDPPSLPEVVQEGAPVGAGQSEPGLHIPDKTVEESAEDLIH